MKIKYLRIVSQGHEKQRETEKETKQINDYMSYVWKL